MLPPDVPVWYRFLDRYGPYFRALYYDCLLGSPFLSPDQLNDVMWVGWRKTVSKRADAIAELDNEVWIIEIAAQPGLRAVGQLLTYQTLWIEDSPILKPEKLILVCENVDPNLMTACVKYGIMTYVV